MEEQAACGAVTWRDHRCSSPSTAVRITETILTTSAPRNAAKKPSTWNPTWNQLTAISDASHKVMPLITSVNRPSVRITSGQESG